MKYIFPYVVMFFYWPLALGVFLLGVGGVISIIHYFSDGVLIFPKGQIKRAIVFGCIAGTAVTLSAIFFNLIDKFKARKSTPSDPE